MSDRTIIFRREPDESWFLERAIPEPNSGCWLWVLAVQAPGYGWAYFDGEGHTAHTLAYRALRGDIPAGTELDHTCKTKACCNPDHLEPVTHQENCRRTYQREATCRVGRHPLSQNSHRVERGWRICIECKREADKRYYEKNRAKICERMRRQYHEQ